MERLENAAVGSRELDEAVCFATTHPYGFDLGDETPPVTTSLDAALSLAGRVLPKSWWPSVSSIGPSKWRSDFYDPETDDIPGDSYAATPALALCAAVLRARQPEKGEEG